MISNFNIEFIPVLICNLVNIFFLKTVNRGDGPLLVDYSKRLRFSKLTVTVDAIVPRGAADADKFIKIVVIPHKCWSEYFKTYLSQPSGALRLD